MSGQEIETTVIVNGKRCTRSVEPRLLLVDFLRQNLRLTGTHLGCAHGVCGACTVLINGRAARSCLTFAAQVNGDEVRTVESLAEDKDLNPLQAAFRKLHALQCGFCTPGFLIMATELLRENPSPTDDEIRKALAGNLCRCTGYVNIISAVKEAAVVLRGDAA